MKNVQPTIDECESSSGVYTVTVNNIRRHKHYERIVGEILRHFLTDGELFFSLFRTDGSNITSAQEKESQRQIPQFFKENGSLIQINEYLSTAIAAISNSVYDFIPSIFDYYLETTVFKPKLSIREFGAYCSDYLNHNLCDIILKNFADILFFYFDSGDFSICFNPQKYTPTEVRNTINRILSA